MKFSRNVYRTICNLVKMKQDLRLCFQHRHHNQCRHGGNLTFLCCSGFAFAIRILRKLKCKNYCRCGAVVACVPSFNTIEYTVERAEFTTHANHMFAIHILQQLTASTIWEMQTVPVAACDNINNNVDERIIHFQKKQRHIKWLWRSAWLNITYNAATAALVTIVQRAKYLNKHH